MTNKTRSEEASALQRWALLLAVLPTAAWVFWEGGRLVSADLASAPARNWVTQQVTSGTQPVSAPEWEAARKALEASLAATPDDPDLHERMGDLHTIAGQRDWKSLQLRRQDFRLAALSYDQATRLRPSEPQTWAMLAVSGQLAGEPVTRVQAAWANARRLGPYEAHVQPTLLQVVLADWPAASPDMRAWTEALFDNGNPRARQEINALAKIYGLQFNADDRTSR